ncbi:MAG: hypothetical protein ABI268_03415, partial [Rhodanobacter sp.]
MKKGKQEIISHWLPRHTDTERRLTLLTNCRPCVDLFTQWESVEVSRCHRSMANATAGGITVMNCGGIHQNRHRNAQIGG